MRQFAFAGALVLVALSAARADAADLSGRWATQSSGGIVEIAACDDGVCGTLVGSPFLRFDPTMRDHRNRDPTQRTRPLKGLTILSGFSGGPEAWTGGRIYNPDDGRTYAASIEVLSADSLRVKGCADRRCRTQVWHRVTD